MFYLCYLYLFVCWCPVRFPYHMMFLSLNSRTTGVTRGTGTTNSSGAPEFITGLVGFVLLDIYFCGSLFVLLVLFFLFFC
jgi:hypothetical protein